MKQILTYPNNAATEYVDPDYIGDVPGNDPVAVPGTGLLRRLYELQTGEYIPWNYPQTSGIPLQDSNGNDRQNLFKITENISKFEQYYLDNLPSGDSNMSRWGISEIPQIVSYVIPQLYEGTPAEWLVKIQEADDLVDSTLWGAVAVTKTTYSVQFGFYDGTEVDLTYGNINGPQWFIFNQSLPSKPDESILYSKRTPDNGSLLNTLPPSSVMFTSQSDGTGLIKAVNTTTSSITAHYKKSGAVIASVTNNNVTWTSEGVYVAEITGTDAITTGNTLRMATWTGAAPGTNPSYPIVAKFNPNIQHRSLEKTSATTFIPQAAGNSSPSGVGDPDFSNATFTGSWINLGQFNTPRTNVPRATMRWGDSQDNNNTIKYNQLMLMQNRDQSNTALFTRSPCHLKLISNSTVAMPSTVGFPYRDYNYTMEVWSEVTRETGYLPDGTLIYLYGFDFYDAESSGNLSAINFNSAAVDSASGECVILPYGASGGYYTEDQLFTQLASNIAIDMNNSPNNPRSSMGSQFEAVIPSNAQYTYKNSSGNTVPFNPVQQDSYWKQGATSKTLYSTNSEIAPVINVLADTAAAGGVYNVVFDTNYPGQFVDPAPGGMAHIYGFENKPDAVQPVTPPAEAQDNFDTDDEWTTTGFDSRKQWPDHITPSSAVVNLNTPSTVNNSQNGVKYTRASGFSKWTLEVEYPPMLPTDFQKFHAIAQAANGQAIPFYFILRNKDNASILWANFKDIQNTTEQAHVVNSTVIGDTLVLTEGFESFEANAFSQGEVPIFGSNQNGALHTVINTANANAYGEAKIRLAMPITTTLTVGSMIYKNPYHCIVTLSSDNFEYTVGTDGYYRMSVSFDLDGFK